MTIGPTATADPAADKAHRLDPQQRTQRFVHRQTEAGDGVSFFGEDGFSFADVIDAVNPLHHIPIVSTIYRQLSGDEIAPAARIAGGALFGGPLGLAAAVANLAVEEASGRDLGAHALALFLEGGEDGPPSTRIAAVGASEALRPTGQGTTDATGNATAGAITGGAADEPSGAPADATKRPSAMEGPSAIEGPHGAADGRHGVSPVVAQRMMIEALEKYEAMRRAQSLPGSVGGSPMPPTRATPGSLFDGEA